MQMIHCVICHRVISTEPARMRIIIINSRKTTPKFKSCSVTMMLLRSCSCGGDDFWCGGPPRLNECSGNTVPPLESPYFQEETFQNIEQEISHFQTQGNLLLMGDLNARTGEKLDFLESHGTRFITGNNDL